MANYVENWITCKSKEFKNIDEKNLLKRYHEAPEFLNANQEKAWRVKYKGVEEIHRIHYFENGTLCFETKWTPLSYEIIKELSRDFDYCFYEWYEETGQGAKILFYKGKCYKEYEYNTYGEEHSVQDVLEDMWKFDSCKANKQAQKTIAKREKDEAKRPKENKEGLPF